MAVSLGVGSGAVGGGKNSDGGSAAVSFRAEEDGPVFVRDGVLSGRAVPEPGLFPPTGREDEDVVVEREGPASVADAERFGPVAPPALDEPDDEPPGRLSPPALDEPDRDCDGGGPLVRPAPRRVDAFQDASQTTQVRLSWAL
ncbi:hypothetical protein [Streptomyces sp. TRM68367]|uniref:hypothetical protein n=1 Tax=Streptomyces sp. TRM68367 TaxID=2758415 RepID=UPI001CA9EBEF|nr:hypothetical protein [Streptomyces sp. TRM68367]